MSIHIHNNHKCSQCQAYYIPYEKGIYCPKCGKNEKIIYPLIPELRQSAKYQKDINNCYTPTTWWNASFGDYLALLIFKVLDYFDLQESTNFQQIAIKYFELQNFDEQIYLKKYIRDLSYKIYLSLEEEYIPTIQELIVKEKISIEIPTILSKLDNGKYHYKKDIVESINFSTNSDKTNFYKIFDEINNIQDKEALFNIKDFNALFSDSKLVVIQIFKNIREGTKIVNLESLVQSFKIIHHFKKISFMYILNSSNIDDTSGIDSYIKYTLNCDNEDLDINLGLFGGKHILPTDEKIIITTIS